MCVDSNVEPTLSSVHTTFLCVSASDLCQGSVVRWLSLKNVAHLDSSALRSGQSL